MLAMEWIAEIEKKGSENPESGPRFKRSPLQDLGGEEARWQ